MEGEAAAAEEEEDDDDEGEGEDDDEDEEDARGRAPRMPPKGADRIRSAVQSKLSETSREYEAHLRAEHPPISAAERWAAVRVAVAGIPRHVFTPSDAACFERRGPACFQSSPWC